MTEMQTTVLLIGETEQNLSEYEKELGQFRVRIAKSAKNALHEISQVKIIVFDLSNASSKRDFELIRSLSDSKTTHLSWIFVGKLDSDAFQAATDLIRHQEILRWRYLKAPLLPNELSTHIKSMLDEEILVRRQDLGRSFVSLRQTLGGLAHEFANLVMRVSARVDLVQAEKDPKRIPIHLEKLNAAAESATQFALILQKLSREKPNLSLRSLSSCVQEAIKDVNPDFTKKKLHFEPVSGPFERTELATEATLELDGTLVTDAFCNVLRFLADVAPEGGKISLSQQAEVRLGEPGIRISMSSSGEEVSAATAKRALHFGGDLRLGIAKQVFEAHGGGLDFPVGSHPEVLIWLPARLYAKT